MSKVTLGLSKILGKTGEPANAGAIFTETSYTTYGLTYEDTCKMQQEDGEETEFYCEEEDDPVDSTQKAGKTVFNFSIMNPDLELLVRLYGGSIATNVYAFPDEVAEIEESIIILPRKGLKFHIPRAKLKTKINGEFSKKGLLLLEVTATVMKPTTAGMKKLYAAEISTGNTGGSGT